jgi:predicted NBD/HSP70 family sugar kinase
MQAGANHETLAGFNQAVVLDRIRRSEHGLSRVELTEASGLSAQSVSNITRRLIEVGIIREGAKVRSGPGKPRTALELVVDSRFAVGVHLDPGAITLVVLDLVGDVRARAHVDMPSSPQPEETIQRMAEEITALLDGSGISHDAVLGVGVASPGPIDHGGGVVVGPALLSGWREVPLRDALSERTGLPTILDKDVTAVAVAEMWVGDHGGSPNLGSIYLGTGVGLGVVIAGEVLRGGYNNVGEIGHLYSGSDEPTHGCGRRGCLGAAVHPRFLVQRGQTDGLLPASHDDVPPDQLDKLYRLLGSLAEAGEPRARKIVSGVAAALTHAIEDIANVLDLDRVVLGGPMWQPISRQVLREVSGMNRDGIVARKIHEIEIVGSELGESAGAIGAACLVLDHFLSPTSTQLQFAARGTTSGFGGTRRM